MKLCLLSACLLLPLGSAMATLPNQRALEIMNPRPNPQELDNFGACLAANDSYLVIGIPRGETNWRWSERGMVRIGSLNPGSTYLYNSELDYVDQYIFTNPEPGGSSFGAAVAIHGTYINSTMVVGAPLNPHQGESNQGKVYVYTSSFNPGVDIPNLTLTSPVPPGGGGDQFGRAVAVNDLYIIVSATGHATTAAGTGVVHIYDRASATPTVPVLSIPNPTPGAGGNFGHALVLVGTRLHVGDPGANEGRGCVHVYDLAGGSPAVPVLTLTSPMAATEVERFGAALSVDGSTLAVGAPDGLGQNGRAYVYNLAGTNPGTPVQSLVNPAPFIWESFGSSVAVRGTRVAVGCPSDLPDLASFLGSVYVYDMASATPATAVGNIQAPGTPQGGEAFGYAVTFGTSADDLLVGAPGNDRIAPDAGDVHRFTLQGGNAPVVVGSYNLLWTKEEFGHAADMDGNHVVVAEGTLLYAYDLSSATPTTPYFSTQVMNPASDDRRIHSVVISGTRVAVCVQTGPQDHRSKGRVYVFDLAHGTGSGPLLVLDCPETTNNNPRYGEYLDLSGPWLAVGARGLSQGYVYDLTSATPGVPVISTTSAGGVVAMSGHEVLMVGAGPTTAKLYDMTSATPAIPAMTRPFTALAIVSISMDGHRFACGNGLGSVSLYDLDSPAANLSEVVFEPPAGQQNSSFGGVVSLRGNHLYAAFFTYQSHPVQVRAMGYDLNVPHLISTQPPATLLTIPEHSSPLVTPDPMVQSGTRVLVGTSGSHRLLYARGSVSIYEAMGGGQIAVERVSGEPIAQGGSLPLGYMADNDKLTGHVVVRNIGTYPLQLMASPQGNVSVLNKVRIRYPTIFSFPVVVPPGGSATVAVAQAECSELGAQWGEARIHTNDPATPIFTLRLEFTGVTRLESWRNRHFGTIVNAGTAADSHDADEDGATNYEEYVTATLPTDKLSKLSVSIGLDPALPNRKRLMVTPVSQERVYSVMVSDDLTPGSWWATWTSDTSFNGFYTDYNSHYYPRRFYQVRVTVP